MYVIARNNSFWLCTTAIEVFEVEAVSLRLQGDMKHFERFEQRLDNWETIQAGVVVIISKCSNATACNECEKYLTSCEVLKAAQATIQAQKEWVEWVESNDGTVF